MPIYYEVEKNCNEVNDELPGSTCTGHENRQLNVFGLLEASEIEVTKLCCIVLFMKLASCKQLESSASGRFKSFVSGQTIFIV